MECCDAWLKVAQAPTVFARHWEFTSFNRTCAVSAIASTSPSEAWLKVIKAHTASARHQELTSFNRTLAVPAIASKSPDDA
eukprot:4062675-Karenia_brevis.AAC.1